MTDPALAAALERIRSAPDGPQVGAFFDYDGTVIDGYSAATFYRHRLRRMQVGLREVAQLIMLGLRGLEDEEDFGRLLTLGFAGWAGHSEQELLDLGEHLFAGSIASTVYPEAWQLVNAHRQKGHTVVLASSATRFQVGPAARALGIDDVLCTEVEVNDAGQLTGRTMGNPLWRSGKAAAVKTFAKVHGIDRRSSFAYSNGDEDVPFLLSVARATAVNPQPDLAAEADERGWPVLAFTSRGRPSLVEAVRSAAAIGGTIGGFATGIALGMLNGSRREGVDHGAVLGAEVGLALAGVQVNVQGEANLYERRPAVYLFNHQSQLDMVLLCRLMQRSFTGVAKKELRNDPMFGVFLRYADMAFVDRGDPAQARAALEPAVAKLRDGVSLVVAPEGTRSATPAIGAFKKGAFHVAMQAQVPVVPIVIRNSGQLMAPKSLVISSGVVDVAVLSPVPTTRWTPQNLDRQVARVREMYVKTMRNWPR
ncbi:HAD-IB family hydrolase [Spongisporangium articulatum]|uniref:1-acyl-sn-glycerol-3-phosphate acyltransferase n=1 Tax=Spongisporangium articulatum TaxID=3362603 RepID=A0ABW8ALK7_9ACTN